MTFRFEESQIRDQHKCYFWFFFIFDPFSTFVQLLLDKMFLKLTTAANYK